VWCCAQSLVIGPDFQHILRILNTNIDGRRKAWVALTAIPGVGRRFAIMICKKAEVDVTKRCVAIFSPASPPRSSAMLIPAFP
jgi:hypothetical protein